MLHAKNAAHEKCGKSGKKRGRADKKDGIKNKGRAMKAGVARAGRLAGITLITYFRSSL